MSQVTNIILTTAAGETQMGDFNKAWDFDGCPRFADVSPLSAGCKNLECNVYVGGFNYLDLAAFIAAIKSIDWRYPEAVQLFVNEHNDERFREVGLWERGE